MMALKVEKTPHKTFPLQMKMKMSHHPHDHFHDSIHRHIKLHKLQRQFKLNPTIKNRKQNKTLEQEALLYNKKKVKIEEKIE